METSMKHIISIIKAFLPKKRYCQVGSNSKFYETSNVINCFKDKNRIILGDNCHVRGELFIFGHGGNIRIGDYCYVGTNTYIWSASEITIGNRVLISHNCNIFDNDTHPLDPVARHLQFKEIISKGHPKKIDLKEKKVFIGDDVLVGANSIILKGVTIGEGAIVAAGSVVTKDVPPFTIVAGNPARVVRELLPGESTAPERS